MMMPKSLWKSILLAAQLCILSTTALPAFAEGAAESAPPVKVLFLGDRGHHHPAERAQQLIPALALRQIDVTYTDRVQDLNPQTLAGYDCLLLYANIDEIGPEAERSLLDFVAVQGKGFVPLHCASWCFRNSPAYVELVGAQFERHGGEVFATKVTLPDHPIMRNLQSFSAWDETYLHSRHGADRQVLQVRPHSGGEEPWTWIRRQGKGRVFYTAYGHDARTWGQAPFQELVARGVLWAAGRDAELERRTASAGEKRPIRYLPARLPNYQSKGGQGEPLAQMQAPLTADESQKHLALLPGLKAELFAAEPQIVKPLCMAFDHRGRLWIAESVDYPNEVHAPGEGNDRIKICEDVDGDGRADKFTIFADKLSIPTSLVFVDAGVIVAQAPDTLLLTDHDGDDRADKKQVLFSGWGAGDTHSGPNNLRWGPDNWIWGMVGYSGFRGKVGGEEHRFGQGFFRFKPDGSKLEFIRSTNNNTWGLGFSEEGLIWGSTANGNASVFMPIANRYYEAVRGWNARALKPSNPDNRFFPITESVRQVDHHGGYTAAAGHALYTARSFPRPYWNRTAFVAEPTGHLVAAFALQPQGAAFVSRFAGNLLASTDEWTAPIAAEVGPDGAVWVIDWYNYVVQHNPTPHGFENGKGNAYVTPHRDHEHGRLWRVVSEGAPPAEPLPQLNRDDPAALVAALSHSNLLWRMHAQRMLVERAQQDVAPALVKLAADSHVDEIGLNVAAMHSLWTLHGLGSLDRDPQAFAAAVQSLRHPSAGVRRAALQVLPRSGPALEALLQSNVLNDADAQVRLAALLALAEMPPDPAAAQALCASAHDSELLNDDWLRDALVCAAARQGEYFLPAVVQRSSSSEAPARCGEIVEIVAQHFARGAHDRGVEPLFLSLASGAPELVEAVVRGLAAAWPANQQPSLTPVLDEAIGKTMVGLSPAGRAHLARLASSWGSTRTQQVLRELMQEMIDRIQDDSEPETQRIAAARQLVELSPNDDELLGEIVSLITPQCSPELAAGLLEALGRSTSDEAGRRLVERLPALTPASRRLVQTALLQRTAWTKAFLAAAEKQGLDLGELNLDQKQSLMQSSDQEIARTAQRVLSRAGGLPSPDRQKVVEECLPLAARTGDAARGKEMFKQHCAKCHRHGGEGGRVGPDLTGMAAHSKQELLVHILDPSRSVEGNFKLFTIVTTEGRLMSGLLTGETRTALQLVDAEGKQHDFQRDEIEELLVSSKSVMPEGFEKQLSPDDLVNLLEFLTARGRFVPLPLDKIATASSTRGMFYRYDADSERLIFDDWSTKMFEGVPFQLVDPRGDRANVILLHSTQGTLPPKMPREATLPCEMPVKAIHLLGGVSGWGYPQGEKGSISLIVRLQYDDGSIEDHPLRNGVHFADYIRQVDVPESKLAYRVRDQQLRYLAIKPRQSKPLRQITFVKGPDNTAPLIMSVTVETPQ